MDQDEFMQDLALKLDLANMELHSIDEVLARRPALAGLKHRTEKIEYACRLNGELLAVLIAVQPFLKRFEGHVINQFGIGGELTQILTRVEAAIRTAKGE